MPMAGLSFEKISLSGELILQAFVAVGPLVGLPADLHGPLHELGLHTRRALELRG